MVGGMSHFTTGELLVGVDGIVDTGPQAIPPGP
jgi:hypothetical protein